MKWVKLNEKFPDDWEAKIIRQIGGRGALDNSNWEHINDRFENTFDYRRYTYSELEWLDETESTEPNQEEELWDEMAHEMDREGIPVGEIESFMIYWKGKYTISRK